MPEKTKPSVGLVLFPALCVPCPSVLLMTEIFHSHQSDSVLFLLCAVALVSAAHVAPDRTVKLRDFCRQNDASCSVSEET